MTVVTIAVVGITAVLLAVALKGMKGEYGTYLVMAAGFFIFFYGVGKLTTILDTIKQVQSYIRINSVYLSTLIKMIGITYVAEFAAGICHGHDQLCGGARWRVSCRFRGDGGRSGDERCLHGFGTV